VNRAAYVYASARMAFWWAVVCVACELEYLADKRWALAHLAARKARRA
jgi:hypothetical protein